MRTREKNKTYQIFSFNFSHLFIQNILLKTSNNREIGEMTSKIIPALSHHRAHFPGDDTFEKSFSDALPSHEDKR